MTGTKSDAGIRLYSAVVACALMFVLLLPLAGRTSAHTGDWIDSPLTAAPPTIDGAMGAGEWGDAAQVDLGAILGNNVPGYLLIKNDLNYVYIAYDATGDTSNSPGDVASVSFDSGHDLVQSTGAEDEFVWGIGALNGQAHYTWNGAAWSLECSPFDTMLPNHGGLAGSYGFGPSDLSATNHQIYELQVPMVLIGVTPGEVIGFLGASWPAPGLLDTGAGFDYSTWPQYLTGPPTLDRYGDLRVAGSSQPDDLDINPPSDSFKGGSGTSVDYTLTIINRGTSVDTFDMGAMSIWPMTLWDATGTNPLTDTDADMVPDTGALGPAMGVDIVARVTVGASGCDDAVVAGVSSNNVNVFDIALLRTCAADAMLNPPHSDAGNDTDFPPNGLFDELRVTVNFVVATDGMYAVEISLYNQNQTTFITSAMAGGVFTAGPAVTIVGLSGLDIYNSGIDGPYYCDITLTDDIGNPLDTGNHTTMPYLFTEFEGPGAALNPPHSDTGVDTDMPPNGLFDALRIDVGVSVTIVGRFAVSIDLFDSSGTFWITSSTNMTLLPMGPNTVSVSMSGIDIYNNGFDGPYIANIFLYDDFSNLLDQGSHNTGIYLFTAFDGPDATLFPPHVDMGVDTDVPPNGLYDELMIGVSLISIVPGTYRTVVDLWDQPMGFWITGGQNSSYISPGPNTIWVTLPGIDIFSSGFAGPYYATIELWDDFGNLLDVGNHFTAAYNFTDFDGLGAQFNPPHSDIGIDTDLPPDGLYDFLQIDVSVSVTDAGTYSIGGPLFDSMMNFIMSASTRTYLSSGNHVVPLQYSGRDIFSSGYDGPYSAYLWLDASNATLDFDIYTTGPYTFDQFQPPSAWFEPPHSDHGLDLSVPPDTIYEFLIIDVSINATRAGVYTLTSLLWDLGGTVLIDVTNVAINLVAGQQQVELRFSSIAIYSSGVDGPYVAEMVLADDLGILDVGTHITGPYLHTDFSPPGASLEPPYAEYAIEADVPPSGGWDALALDVGVNATVAGEYLITGVVVTTSTAFVAADHVRGTLPVGVSVLTLEFDGHNIADIGIAGPFMIFLSLYDEFGRMLDNDVYATNPYLASDFERPDTLAPTAAAGSLFYWQTNTPVDVPYSASDPAPTDGLLAVVLHYRYSADNNTWGPWNEYAADGVTGSTAFGSIQFAFPDGTGYYEFQMTAVDAAYNMETLGPAEAKAAYLPPEELRMTPSSLIFTAGQQMTITVGVYGGGQPVIVQSDLVVNLRTWSPTGEYRDVGGSTAITTITIPAGESSVDVDYYDESAGTWDLLVYTTTGLGGEGQATIAAASAAILSVNPPAASVQVGGTQQFTATIHDAYGNAVAGTITWSVSGAIGGVSASGLLTAGTVAGAGTVVATSGTLQDYADVTITPGAASTLRVTPSSATVRSGTTVDLVAEVLDAYGNRLSAAGVAWTISGPGDLSAVSGATTTLTSEAVGTIAVTATIGSLTVTATFTSVETGTTAAQPSDSTLVIVGALIGGLIIGLIVGMLFGRKRGKEQTMPQAQASPPPPPQGMPPQAPPQQQAPSGGQGQQTPPTGQPPQT